MNILLVDDEHLTLEALLTRLDWSRFQFAHIFNLLILAHFFASLTLQKYW